MNLNPFTKTCKIGKLKLEFYQWLILRASKIRRFMFYDLSTYIGQPKDAKTSKQTIDKLSEGCQKAKTKPWINWVKDAKK